MHRRALGIASVAGLVSLGAVVGAMRLVSSPHAVRIASPTSGPSTTAETASSTTPETEAPTTAPTTTSSFVEPDRIQRDEIFVEDPSRPPPPRLASTSAVRTLRVVIRRPSDAVGPFPVVVFAHGFNVEPEDYLALLDAWAEAGYLVAAPEFPASARNLPGEPSRDDIEGQAADLSAVITALLDGRAGPIDPRRIAVAGHSDGGTTVAEMLLDPGHADPRVAAYLVLSGATPTSADGVDRAPGPVLFAVGSGDDSNVPEAQGMFAIAGAPAVLIDVVGGDHMTMYVSDTSIGDAVRAASLDFLALALPSVPDAAPSLMSLEGDKSSYLDITLDP